MPDENPLTGQFEPVPPEDGRLLCNATTPVQVMVPGKFGFTDARLYCDQPAGHPGRHRAQTSTGTRHWEGPTYPVGPVGEAMTGLARNLCIPDDAAREIGQQAERAVDDQLAVLHAAADRLARIAWREDNQRMPPTQRTDWADTTPNERAPYLAHALAAAAELVVCGLLAPHLPDAGTEPTPENSSTSEQEK